MKEQLETMGNSYEEEKNESEEEEPLIKQHHEIVWKHWMKLLEQILGKIEKGNDENVNVGYIEFKSFYQIVPHWWHFGHDILLLELALQFGLDIESYLKEIHDEEAKIKNIIKD